MKSILEVRGGAAAESVGSLEYRHSQPAAAQQRRGRQPGQAAADDHHVEVARKIAHH